MFVCRLFFFSHSLGCILVAIKKCEMSRRKPLDESLAKTEFFKEVDKNGGRGAVSQTDRERQSERETERDGGML